MASPTTHLDLDNTFGAYLIGTFLGFLYVVSLTIHISGMPSFRR